MRALAIVALAACATGRGVERRTVSGELRIPAHETRRIALGASDARTVVLRLLCRIDSAKPAGSMYFAKLALDGHPLDAALDRNRVRLRDHALVAPVSADQTAPWFDATLGWRVSYAPAFDAPLELDVSDLAGAHALEITNTGGGTLVVGAIEVELRDEPSPMTQPAIVIAPPVNRGTRAAGAADYRAALAHDGSLEILVGGERVHVESEFAARSGPIAMERSTPALASGADAALAVARSVSYVAGRIDIVDAVENRLAEPLGVRVEHHTPLVPTRMATVRLAGSPDPAIDDAYAPANPTVYFATAHEGIAIACDDDVLRNQARLFARAGTAGVRTEMLRLAPHERYELRWSIYLTASTDYYDLIDRMRVDRGANARVDGAWLLGFQPEDILGRSPDELRALYRRQGIRYAILAGGWVDRTANAKRIGFGSDVLGEGWRGYRERVASAVRALHAAVPEVRALGYYDTQRDSRADGPEQFRDSRMLDGVATQRSTTFGEQSDRSYSYVATLRSSYGRAMLDAVDRYFDELGFDGIYWDEMELVSFDDPNLSYGEPDGHSCLQDPRTHACRREVGLVALLGLAHRRAVVARIAQHRGVLLGNGPAMTAALAVPWRMTEIQHNERWAYQALLGTPLGYISGREDFAAIVRALDFGLLPVGTRATYAHEISRFLFPFTPIELHAGYLLGEERIVATHDGDYGWGDTSLVAVHTFDARGALVERATTTRIDREARTKIALARGEAVVIERLPVRVVRGAITQRGDVIDAPEGARLEPAHGPAIELPVGFSGPLAR